MPKIFMLAFGTWEGSFCNDIWAAEGEAMNGMIEAPKCYRPGGGETTAELAARVLGWFRDLAPDASVAAHGGPIATLAGSLLEEAPQCWLHHIPAPGCGLRLEVEGSGWRVTPWRPIIATCKAHD